MHAHTRINTHARTQTAIKHTHRVTISIHLSFREGAFKTSSHICLRKTIFSNSETAAAPLAGAANNTFPAHILLLLLLSHTYKKGNFRSSRPKRLAGGSSTRLVYFFFTSVLYLSISFCFHFTAFLFALPKQRLRNKVLDDVYVLAYSLLVFFRYLPMSPSTQILSWRLR